MAWGRDPLSPSWHFAKTRRGKERWREKAISTLRTTPTACCPARPWGAHLGQEEADVRTAPPHANALCPRPCRPHGLNPPACPGCRKDRRLDPPGVPLSQKAPARPPRKTNHGGGQPGCGGRRRERGERVSPVEPLSGGRGEGGSTTGGTDIVSRHQVAAHLILRPAVTRPPDPERSQRRPRKTCSRPWPAALMICGLPSRRSRRKELGTAQILV